MRGEKKAWAWDCNCKAPSDKTQIWLQMQVDANYLPKSPIAFFPK